MKVMSINLLPELIKRLALLLLLAGIWSCSAENTITQVPGGTYLPVSQSTSEIYTDIPVLTPPSVVENPPQQITVDNISKLNIYANITFPKKVNKILWLSYGNSLGLLVNDKIHLYSAPDFSPNGEVVLPRRRAIYSITYIEDFGNVMLIDQDGNLLLWSLAKSESLRDYPWSNVDLVSAQISPSSNLIARSGVQIQDRKRIIEIIDLSGNVIQTLVGHKNDAPILDFSPDEMFLVGSAMGRDTSHNLIYVWSISTGNLLYTLPDSTGDEGITKFNHSGDKVAVTVGDVIRLWDMNSQNWLGNDWKYDIGESYNYINSLSFSLSDDLIIATTNKNKVLFVNAHNGDLLDFPDRSQNIVDAVFSPDNRYLATLYSNGTIDIWVVTNR